MTKKTLLEKGQYEETYEDSNDFVKIIFIEDLIQAMREFITSQESRVKGMKRLKARYDNRLRKARKEKRKRTTKSLHKKAIKLRVRIQEIEKSIETFKEIFGEET